jgi:hypothetical protein
MDDLQVGNGSGNRGITISSGASNFGTLAFGDSADNSGVDQYAGAIEYYHLNNSMSLLTSSVPRLTIDSSGRLLVGTSSTIGVGNDLVMLKGTSVADASIYCGRNANASSISDGNNLGFIKFGGGDGGLAASVGGVADAAWSSTSDCPGRLVFSTTANGASTPTERMQIDSMGRLMVGTTTEGTAAAMQLTVSSSSNTGITIRSGTSSSSTLMFADATLGSGAYRAEISYAHATDHMAFTTNGGHERLRITSAGKIGVGTTNPANQFEVVSSVATKANFTHASSNKTSLYLESDDTSARIGSTYFGSGGSFKPLAFLTAGTERMQINSSGNIFFSSGNVGVTGKGGTNTAFYVTDTANSNATTVSLNANGSATFAASGSFGNEVYVNGSDTSTQRYLNFSRPTSGQYRATLRRDAWYLGETVTNIGNVTPSGANIKLKMNGDAIFSGSVTASNVSDVRFKENITDANPQLADAVALGSQLKNFDWNDDAPLNEELRAKRFLGLVAQEAEKVCPGLTYTVPRTKQGKELTPAVLDEEGNETKAATYEELDDSYKAINHDILVMKLLGAVAELSAKVAALEAG